MVAPRGSSTASVPSLAPSHGRAVGIDIVRFLGICAIVVGHVSSTPWVAKATFTWHVPVFFFLTGVLWSPGATVRQDVVKRVVSLGRPYLAWLLAISVLATLYEALQGDHHFIVQRARSIVLGGSYLTTPYTAFWFFSCLFFACVLWRLGEFLRIPLWAMAVVALSLALLGPQLARPPLSAGTAVAATVFIAAGRAYRLAPNWLKSWPIGLTALTVAVIAVMTGLDPPVGPEERALRHTGYRRHVRLSDLCRTTRLRELRRCPDGQARSQTERGGGDMWHRRHLGPRLSSLCPARRQRHGKVCLGWRCLRYFHCGRSSRANAVAFSPPGSALGAPPRS
jgi:hypothetical protein